MDKQDHISMVQEIKRFAEQEYRTQRSVLQRRIQLKIIFLRMRGQKRQQQLQPLKTYDHISQLPATLQERPCTDVFCLISGIAFTVIMLIVATATYNHQNYLKSNFPADSDGSLCGQDFPQYQYLYFANLPDINHRICVESCPKPGEKTTKCQPTNDIGCKIGTNNQKFTAQFYQSTPYQTRGGFFCWPTNQQQQQQINDQTNLQKRNAFYNSIDTIKYSIGIAVLISVIYFVLVQFLADKITLVTVILGIIVLLTTSICVFTYNTNHTTARALIGLFLLAFAIFFVFTVWKHWDSIELFSIYLKWSTKMCQSRILSTLYIIIFFVFLVGFIAIMIWEFTGFWTAGSLQYDPASQIYHQLYGSFPTIMMFFMVIQIIWGLSFIKQAFNFCVSGNSVHWFLQENKGDKDPHVKKDVFYPAIVMIRKHLGTVIAGAFMTGFFSVLDAIFDFLRPDEGHCFKFYVSCCTKVNFIFKDLFDFVRSDALAYVNLAGNPYCNSSRFCEMLCYKSKTTQYSQSTSRVYRLSAHFLIMGIVGVIALYMNGKISMYAELLILIITVFISTLFISFHADSAEAIQITLLTIEGLYHHNHMGHNLDLNALLQVKKEGFRVNLVDEVYNERKQQIEKQKQKEAGRPIA